MESFKRTLVFGGAIFALAALSACATQGAPPATSSPAGQVKKPAQSMLARTFPFIHSKAPAPSVSPKPAPPSPPPAAQPLPEKPASPVLFSSIPDDPSIQLYIDYFQYADHRRFKKWLERSHEYLPYIQQTFREMGLPEDLAYVSLIESGFSARAYSRTGAAGLWQFMRGTGIKYGLKVNWWIDQRRDPILATRSAAQYLKDLHDEFDSWELALAAYNAGEGRVANAVSRAGTKDYWKLRRTRAFSSETRNYVPKMIAAMTIAKNPEKYGFTDLAYHPAIVVRQKEIHRSVEIRALARAMNMTVSEFLAYNPQFIRWATPPPASVGDGQRPRGGFGRILEAPCLCPREWDQSGCSRLPRRIGRLPLVHRAPLPCSPSGADSGQQPEVAPSPAATKTGHSGDRKGPLDSACLPQAFAARLLRLDRPSDPEGGFALSSRPSLPDLRSGNSREKSPPFLTHPARRGSHHDSLPLILEGRKGPDTQLVG